MSQPENLLQIIGRKRDGYELSDQQIHQLIDAFVSGHLHDYQMSAFAMAVLIRGMSEDETVCLTKAMLDSGTKLQWPADKTVVSKHSTGGVGDKVSLVLVPLLAACGLNMPKISGRGLGTTGGTLDKLESLTGFRTNLSTKEITSAVDQVGCCITGTTQDIAPADQKLYALRDATATVPSTPLVVSSILSKKLAENPSMIMLDVKYGTGSFTKDPAAAIDLAEALSKIGHRLGVPTEYLITDMNEPLGSTIGNYLEVQEAMLALEGEGESRLMEVVHTLATKLMKLASPETTLEEHNQTISKAMQTGRAREVFDQMIAFQGGDPKTPSAGRKTTELLTERDGYISEINPEKIGWALIELGGGRKQKTDKIDHHVGCELQRCVGDRVHQGEAWLRLHCSTDPGRTERAIQYLTGAITIADSPPQKTPLIL